MKKRIMKAVSIVMICLMMFGMVACGNSNSDSKQGDIESKGDSEIKIGVVLKTLASEYWQYVKSGLEEGAKEAGVSIEIVGPNSESDISGQISMIEDMISQGVDAICIAPNQADSVSTVLKSADEKGIPVFFIDTDGEFDNKVAFLGPGNEAAATLGGEYAAELVGSGRSAVIIRGRLGDVTHDLREAGFRAPLEEAGIEVLDVQPGDSDSEEAMSVMEDFIQKYDKIDAVLCCNDEMAQGAQRAVEQAGLKDVKIIGFGANNFILDPIEKGDIAASISINPYDMGKTAALDITSVVKGETIAPVVESIFD